MAHFNYLSDSGEDKGKQGPLHMGRSSHIRNCSYSSPASPASPAQEEPSYFEKMRWEIEDREHKKKYGNWA